MTDFNVYGKIACILYFEQKQPGELFKIEKKPGWIISTLITGLFTRFLIHNLVFIKKEMNLLWFP